MDGNAVAAAVVGRRREMPALAVVRAWWRLPHPTAIVVVLAATAGFAVLCYRGVPPLGELALLLAAMLGGQLAVGAANEIVDADLDRVGKPWKPIPAGLVSPSAARWLVVGGLAVMVACGARFGPAAMLLLAAGTGLGLVYDVWFKRTAFCWLPYVLALPLLPVWVWTALGRYDPLLLLLYPLGAAAAVGVHLAQALPDAASDRAAGLRNAVSRLGERRAFAASLVLAASAPLVAATCALLVPAWLADPRQVLASAALAGALLAASAAAYAVAPRVGVRACFPLVASSAVVVALGWVLGALG